MATSRKPKTSAEAKVEEKAVETKAPEVAQTEAETATATAEAKAPKKTVSFNVDPSALGTPFQATDKDKNPVTNSKGEPVMKQYLNIKFGGNRYTTIVNAPESQIRDAKAIRQGVPYAEAETLYSKDTKGEFKLDANNEKIPLKEVKLYENVKFSKQELVTDGNTKKWQNTGEEVTAGELKSMQMAAKREKQDAISKAQQTAEAVDEKAAQAENQLGE